MSVLFHTVAAQTYMELLNDTNEMHTTSMITVMTDLCDCCLLIAVKSFRLLLVAGGSFFFPVPGSVGMSSVHV